MTTQGKDSTVLLLNHGDHTRCFEQGIPGRDGKDGTPGLDGEKVSSVRAPAPPRWDRYGSDRVPMWPVCVCRVMQGATESSERKAQTDYL